ncbi:tetratricopeptide repeat protein [Pseudomonas sp. FP1740]|uniref:tetratricopeptide repeat protein n=1 Tax=Pseudomonas sp. FP1740 TaxID=2954078 RepID=UPI002733026C|nr:tetratricopeptide repeat protein [Pseudomonas sp. FP1740]WLG43453.1 tetratricopeptide repeat protein [Pseudomonas sp. FP1740]
MRSVESPLGYKVLGGSSMLVWLAVLFHVIYLLALQPNWLLGGAMWAEMGQNYFNNANATSLLQNFFAVDAGYVPLPQRIVAYVGALFSLPAVSIPYYYNWMSVVLVSFLICSFAADRFRAVIESDYLRFFVVLAVLMVADFETRTFINFTYFSVFFIGVIIALSLLDRDSELPAWTWLIPIIFVSKPSVMTILPALLIAAMFRSGRVRAIAIVSVMVCLLQMVQLFLSASSGWTPLQASDSSLFYKCYLAVIYTLTLFSRFLVGPSFQSSMGVFVGVGAIATFVFGWFAVKSRSSRPLMLVGCSLVFFTALLNCLAFGRVWDSSFLPTLSDFRISRYVIAAYIGFVFIVSALSVSFMSSTWGASNRISRFAGLAIFSVWFIGAGWASYGAKISRDWTAPGVGNSYWKEFSSSIDQGISPLCVPIDPFPWLYGRNCEWLTPLPEQAYILKRVLKSEAGFVIEVPVPESVQGKKLISIGLFVKPVSDLDVRVHGRALVENAEGGRFELKGDRMLSNTGGLLLLTQAPGAYIESVSRIQIFFDRGVDVAYQQRSELQPSIILMGTKYIPEDVSSILKRAGSGDALAQLLIGKMYGEGLGVTKNLGEAVNWYMKAALSNNPEAQYILARAYYFGTGVPENRNEALVWYKRAASLGSQDAVMALEKLESKIKK